MPRKPETEKPVVSRDKQSPSIAVKRVRKPDSRVLLTLTMPTAAKSPPRRLKKSLYIQLKNLTSRRRLTGMVGV